MTNPTPPYGWRIVDKAKDDPKEFSRQTYWANGEWLDIRHDHLARPWTSYEIFAVPIDPGPDHRLIDQSVDKAEDHPDAEIWDVEALKWMPRIRHSEPWYSRQVYRTPIKKAEPMPNEYDAEWFTGVPTEEEVGDNETCWFAVPINDSWEITGKAARSAKKLLAWTPRLKPKPYVPPKLPQPGEVWEMRNGERAYPAAAYKLAESLEDYLIGWSYAEGEILPASWTAKGNIVHGQESPCDLIKHLPNEPWPKEIVR